MAKETGWGGWILILVGGLLLLHTLGLMELGSMVRYWPLILIAIGVRIVLNQRSEHSRQDPPPPPPSPATTPE